MRRDNEINERMFRLIKNLVPTQAEFARRLKTTRSYVNQLVKPGGAVGKDAINKIVELFPEVNATWILTGEGDMFLDGRHEKNFSMMSYQDVKGVPIFDIPVMGGNVEVYTDMSHSKPVGYVNIPGYLDCDFCLPVYGDSMYPMYKNGSFIICKWVPKDHKINWGRIYYIEWDNYREVKILVRGDTDEDIELHSLNDQKVNGRLKYHPVTIKHKEVRRIALVKGGFLKDSH